MKTVNVATTENKAIFFVDVYGDIFDTQDDADFMGLAGTVTMDDGYPGSIEQMRQVALDHYNA